MVFPGEVVAAMLEALLHDGGDVQLPTLPHVLTLQHEGDGRGHCYTARLASVMGKCVMVNKGERVTFSTFLYEVFDHLSGEISKPCSMRAMDVVTATQLAWHL